MSKEDDTAWDLTLSFICGRLCGVLIRGIQIQLRLTLFDLTENNKIAVHLTTKSI